MSYSQHASISVLSQLYGASLDFLDLPLPFLLFWTKEIYFKKHLLGACLQLQSP